MQTFFTADTHFDHKNIIQYCHRPFISMDDELVAPLYQGGFSRLEHKFGVVIFLEVPRR
jgi:hypothetical protein